ncbi:MAG: flagellar biosynthesis protein FlhB [Blastocatellia bacterium]
MSQSGEKTEKPTRKRLRDARKKGQVAKSQDLTQAILLLSAVIVVVAAGGFTGSVLTASLTDWTHRAGTFRGEITLPLALTTLRSSLGVVALALAPLLAAMFLIALLTGYAQVGGMFVSEPLKPDFKKLNPAEGFKNKFLKLRPWVELVRTMIKMLICGVLIMAILWSHRVDIVNAAQLTLPQTALLVSQMITEIGWKVAVVFVILGIGDFFLQQFLYRKELMMTKHEIREEYKETEGNPLHKNARRRAHRDVLSRNLPQAVRQATVVVVNPTHLAVALTYEEASGRAPVVAASGADLMAARIRELARAAGVPIIRDAPLARALYQVEIEEEIPEDLYEPVAIVLSWVFRLAQDEAAQKESHG